MRRKKILSLPTLKSRKGDLNKLWYVEIGMRNPKSGEYERKRYYSLSEKDFSVAINEKNSVEERYIEGQKIIEYLTEKLKRGWTIFDEPEEVKFFCEKSLIQYSHEATIYQKKLSNNRTYEFLVSSYLKENLSNWDKSTCDTYTGRYRRFGLWLQENELHKIDIAEITNQMIVDFFNFQKNEKDLTRDRKSVV